MTNRHPKLPLNEAWRHYWSALFPAGGIWSADLEAEIRKRLYFPGKTFGFLDGGLQDPQPPTWSRDLEVGFQDNSVVFRFQDIEFDHLPLFADRLVPVLGNWTNSNPLERASSSPQISVRDRADCREFLDAATRDCGNRIKQHLLQVLKVAERPGFEIYCRPSDDVFSDERRLPTNGLADIQGIDVLNNTLNDRLGRPLLSAVRIKQRSPSPSKAGPHGSFAELDAVLVERMKRLIEQGTAGNVRQAASMLLLEAPMRKSSSEDSVLRRLQDRFSRKYPDFSNRRGRRDRQLN